VAFHSAVEMSFSPLRLTDSFDFNLRATLDLYDLLAHHARNSPRFFHISTAYTGGIGEPLYPEALHVSPRFLNPYQASKWSAEMALHLRGSRGPALPVTLFRPSVVVGHSATGWYGVKTFGLYNYLDSVHAGLAIGAEELRFDIDPDVAHDYVFIDTVVDDVRVLMERETAAFSVVHSTGTRNSNAWRMERIGKAFGIPLHFGKAITKADRIANRNQPFNEPFNVKGLEWHFETKRVAALTGRERVVAPMNDASFGRLIEWYRAHRLK
jgi:nucleoside-diphosphate-sugar epimerase